MCAFFLKAYLKSDFTANLLISSENEIFVTIFQPLSVILKKQYYEKICKCSGHFVNNFDIMFWLYTVDLGNVCYNG